MLRLYLDEYRAVAEALDGVVLYHGWQRRWFDCQSWQPWSFGVRTGAQIDVRTVLSLMIDWVQFALEDFGTS